MPNDTGGHWVTMNGAHVFIKDGTSEPYPDRLKRAHDVGRKLAEHTGDKYNDWADGKIAGMPDMTDYYNEAHDDAGMLAFQKRGEQGRGLPQEVAGWRYGKAPDAGRSTNFRDAKFETGISMMEVSFPSGEKSNQTLAMQMYEAFNGKGTGKGRGKHHYRGWHVGYGADGEPLIVDAKPIPKHGKESEELTMPQDKPTKKSAESAEFRCIKCGAAIAEGRCPNGHGETEPPAQESAAPGVVTLFGVSLTRGAAFESAEIVAPDAAELHTGCMVEDARHDPDKGDYHLRICEAGANERKRRIYPNETIESADLSLYADRKMYLNHDREAEEKGEVRRVEDLAAVVKAPWLVKASEAGAAGSAAIDAIAHVFPNAPHGFAQNMRDPEFRKAVAASHVFRYKGYYGTEEGTGHKWEVITEITGIDSVDFVTEPGARGRMMESAGADAPKENAVDFKALTVEQLREARPDLAQMIGEAAVATHRAHESDATEVETLTTKLTAAQTERDTARSALRDTQIAREVEVAVAAEGSGIPKAVQPDVATEVTAAVRGLPPTETEGPKLKTAVESVVKQKSELLRKVSQPPSPDVTPGKRGAGAQTEQSKGEGVLRSYLH